MTFYEAAIEVLREEGRPLHFKKIAEIAQRRSLLSHVGKKPEVTMGARLQQEVKKSDNETLIIEVRTGVYNLREGVDASEARETIRFEQEQDAENAESAQAAAEAEAAEESKLAEELGTGSEAENMVAAAPESANNDRRRRRRGRRGGRGRSREGGEEIESTDKETTEVAPKSAKERKQAPKADKRKEVLQKLEGANRRRERENSGSAPLAGELAIHGNLEGVGDIGRHAVKLLSKVRSLSLRKLARSLSEQNIGELGLLGTSVLRHELETVNAKRTLQGRPPLFEEVRPGHWAMAAASGSALASSYAKLNSWQDDHRELVANTLMERLRTMEPGPFGTILTLLLDRMGYRNISPHERIGEELITLSAHAPRGLTSAQIAVRATSATEPLTREDVIALRGSLHIYSANEGAIIALAGISDEAKKEAVVPNLAPITLIGPNELAEHLLRYKVGVLSYNVTVSCVDEMLLRDLNHAD